MPSLRTIIILLVLATALLAIAPLEQVRQIPFASEIGLLNLREFIRGNVTQLFHTGSEIAKDFIKLFIGDIFNGLQQSAETTIEGL